MFVKYAFLAESVSFDVTGKMSAIGIFEVINALKFPALQLNMHLVVNLEGTIGEKGDHAISIELRDRDGNRLMPPFEQKLTMGAPTITHGVLRAGLVLKVQAVQFLKAGQYEFVVFADDRFLHRITFEVQQVRVALQGEA
jgi:hypothetical protein